MYTAGKETSGSAVTGSRTKAISPRNRSTPNNTIGGSGGRMAHAEVFLMSAPPSGCRLPRGGPRDLHFLALAPEPPRGGPHAPRSRRAGGDHPPLIRGVRYAHRAALGATAGVDHVDVAAVEVGQHRGLRHYRPLRLTHGHHAACERAGAQRRVRL